MRMEAEDLQQMNKVLRHQLRNFASGVKNAVSLLEFELKGQLSPESAEYFPLIRDECMQLFALTERMGLLFDGDCPERLAARAESPPVTLGALLGGVLAQMRAEFPAADVNLEVEASALAEPVPAGRAVALALGEMVRNAVEAARAVRVVIRCDRQDDRLCLHVADNGPGLKGDDPSMIFKPFHTTRSKHAGIGLSIAAEVLAEKDGLLTAQANSDGGLTVTLRIPMSNGGTP